MVVFLLPETITPRIRRTRTTRLGSDKQRPGGSVDTPQTKAVEKVAPALPIAHRSLLPVRVALDVLALVGALAIAALLRFGLRFLEISESSELIARSHWIASGVWSLALLLALVGNRLYDEDTLFVGGGEITRVVRSVMEATAVIALFVFVTQSFYVSRSWFGLTVVFSVLFLTWERIGMRSFVRRARSEGRHRRHVILVSRDDSQDWFVDPTGEFEVIAALDPAGFRAVTQDDASPAARGVVVVLRARDFSHDEFWDILVSAGQLGWSTFVHSPVRSVGRDRLTVRDLAGHAVVKVAPPTLTGINALSKRAFDIVVSITLLVLLAPIFLVITVISLATSGRPLMYRQERVGAGGHPFSMLKFRSMRSDSEPDGAQWTTRDDPRRTSIGRVLRRTSADELPQLWNVLKGDMSLVGPRPEQPPFASEFGERLPWYRFRHRIKPGMTGWAQSHSLRGNTPIDDRVEFDNWYIENWSIWLDLKILLMTIREVLRGENAY